MADTLLTDVHRLLFIATKILVSFMNDQHFLEDGPERAMQGAQQQITDLTEQIKADVELEFYSRMSEAGLIKRIYLRQRMKREIRLRVEQEIEKIAPTGGLYIRA